jgi:TRAP-type C4-dicarboxylate transport system permease small subunit
VKNLRRLYDRVVDLFAWLAGGLVLLIMLSITGEMVSRYLFDSALTWTLQFSEYTLLYIVFLGAPWLLREDGHPSLDLLVNKLSPQRRALARAATSLVGLAICLFVAAFSAWTTWNQFLSGASDPAMIEVPRWTLLIIIPIGSLLLGVQFGLRCADQLAQARGRTAGAAPPDPLDKASL